MLDPADFLAASRDAGIQFFTGVPDSLLKHFCAVVDADLPARQHIIAANEGAAVALAAGHHLATGEVPLVYLQNSGHGNTINPLLSLADPDVYGIPMVLLVGWRGEPGVADEPQHRRQGSIMRDLNDAIGLPTLQLAADPDAAARDIAAAVAQARDRGGPVAILVSKGTFAAADIEARPDPYGSHMAREEALRAILAAAPANAAIVATTGKTGREIFELRAHGDAGHDRDFLSVGSMGHASQIALGIANASDRPVWCIDGDGALLMHMGSVAIIGQHAPANLKHIVCNNAAHESVGGQATAAAGMDLPALAIACGYRNAWRVTDAADLPAALADLAAASGPVLLEIRIRKGSRSDLGRPTRTPQEAKAAFQAFLRGP